MVDDHQFLHPIGTILQPPIAPCPLRGRHAAETRICWLTKPPFLLLPDLISGSETALRSPGSQRHAASCFCGCVAVGPTYSSVMSVCMCVHRCMRTAHMSTQAHTQERTFWESSFLTSRVDDSRKTMALASVKNLMIEAWGWRGWGSL